MKNNSYNNQPQLPQDVLDQINECVAELNKQATALIKEQDIIKTGFGDMYMVEILTREIDYIIADYVSPMEAYFGFDITKIPNLDIHPLIFAKIEEKHRKQEKNKLHASLSTHHNMVAMNKEMVKIEQVLSEVIPQKTRRSLSNKHYNLGDQMILHSHAIAKESVESTRKKADQLQRLYNNEQDPKRKAKILDKINLIKDMLQHQK